MVSVSLTLYTPASLYKFSLLVFIHFVQYWLGELQHQDNFGDDYFFISHERLFVL